MAKSMHSPSFSLSNAFDSEFAKFFHASYTVSFCEENKKFCYTRDASEY